MTPEHQVLLTALAEFVSDASTRAADLAGLADREAAQAMVHGPRARAVRQAATAAAYTNAYLADEDRPRPGRVFDERMLHRLGIAGLLRSGHPFDEQALVSQIAGYLAGPPEPLWRYIVLDLEWTQPEPMQIAGWRLHQPSESEWKELRPIPAAAEFAAEDIWDPLLSFGKHLVLSAPDENEEAAAGHRIFWFPRMEESFEVAWLPLLLLNLWNDDPVTPVAEYLVEARRVVDRVYASIPTKLVGEEGEFEVPQLGPLSVDLAHSPHLIRFLADLTARLEPWQTQGPTNRKLVRLRRSALRFLAAGSKVAYDNKVFFPGDRPHVILNYVSALENLLSGTDTDQIDLSRRTAQRAAILVGTDDTSRETIFKQVRGAYGVRSTIAHGSDPDDKKLTTAIADMRPILRRALTYTIALGPHPDIGLVCDEALLSHATLRDKIRGPIENFRRTVRNSDGGLRHSS